MTVLVVKMAMLLNCLGDLPMAYAAAAGMV